MIEKKDKAAYKKISIYTRILIRLTIFTLTLLSKRLVKYNMSSRFYIYENGAKEVEEAVVEKGFVQ